MSYENYNDYDLAHPELLEDLDFHDLCEELEASGDTLLLHYIQSQRAYNL